MNQSLVPEQPYPITPMAPQPIPLAVPDEKQEPDEISELIDGTPTDEEAEADGIDRVINGTEADNDFLFGGANDPYIVGGEDVEEVINGRPEDDEFIYGTGSGEVRETKYSVQPKRRVRRQSIQPVVGSTFDRI